MAKKTYDTAELAALAGVTRRAVQHWIRNGQLKAISVPKKGRDGHYRVAYADWKLFMKGRAAPKGKVKK